MSLSDRRVGIRLGAERRSTISCWRRNSTSASQAARDPNSERRSAARKLIPTALDLDVRPITGADRSDAVWVVDQEVPCLLAGLDDLLIGVPDQPAKLVGAQVLPDDLHRVQLRRI